MQKGFLLRVPLLIAVAMLASTVSFSADAQQMTSLIRQDFSDCNNSEVNANNPSLIGGAFWVVRQSNGSTTAKVGITASPDTTYNLYHKCVGQIGTITTGDEGVGEGVFTFQTNPGILTFDMYPNGAPAGNKFQSVPINVQ
jgi:hypothetical protein